MGTRLGEFGEPRPAPNLLSCALSRGESVTVNDLASALVRRTLPQLSGDVGVCAIKMLAAPIRCVPRSAAVRGGWVDSGRPVPLLITT